MWTGLSSPDELNAAYERIQDSLGRNAPGADVKGMLVLPMRPLGIELLAGITVDESFGLILTLGIGGIWVEVFKDVAHRVLPVQEGDIREMLFELKGKSLFTGARNGVAANIEGIVDAVKHLVRGAVTLGNRLDSLEINPLWCHGDQVEALDALIVTK